jgi:hypothetical protein
MRMIRLEPREAETCRKCRDLIYRTKIDGGGMGFSSYSHSARLQKTGVRGRPGNACHESCNERLLRIDQAIAAFSSMASSIA